MRALLALAALSACLIAATCDPVPAPPPHTVVRQQVAQKRISYGGDTLQRLVSWIFPGQEKNSRAYAAPAHHSPAIFRAPPKYGPPPRAKFTGHLPPPQKCNPCNKVPWIPIPHAQFQDGGAVFAVVNAPQLHQGLHGGEQPSIPVYHHTPLPQGYLPGSPKPEGSVAVEEHVAAPSGAGSPEIVPSIPVADFISSIEYPINVVQSPIIDVESSKGVQHEAQETKLDLPAVGEVEHNEQPAPAAATTVAVSNHNDNTPLAINSGIGGGTSYQNTNFDHTKGITITPSIQTASGPINPPPAPLVHGPPPPQILTQEQPPLNIPAPPFHVPTFQQGPGASAPSGPGLIFTGPAAPFPSGGQRLPPIGFTGPQQPNTFLHAPTFHHQPPPQPIRQFTSPGTLRQLPPSAEGLQPPPLPAQPVAQHPYKFEFFPPTVTNGLLNVNIQSVPTTQAPWTPSAPPAESGPALIEAANPQPQNSILDAEASGLRNHWHHREINHQFQESKLVASEVAEPQVKETTTEKPVTHILASDLRKLLLRDQEKQQQQALNSLQNNIDSWTAQEFSNPDTNNIVDDTNKQTSTTAVAATSAKAIPNEYFPTSPSYFQTSPRPAYFDHEASGSISHNVHAKVFSKGAVIKAARARPTTEASTTTTTTTEEPTTTDFTTDYPTTTPEPKRTTTWDRLTVGFSKSSNEKVYVVTPMSTHEWTAGTTTTPKIPTTSTEKSSKGYFVKSKIATKYYETTTTSDDTTVYNASAFRSPRFTVRPTIASVAKIVDVRTASPISRGNRYYTVPTPDSFDTSTVNPVTAERRSSNAPLDLTTLPTYTPPAGQSVQTTDGHSKVVTVVSSESSSSSVKKATRLSIKPVKVEKPAPLKQESKEDEEEVVAAVREVSAIELRRKAAAATSA